MESVEGLCAAGGPAIGLGLDTDGLILQAIAGLCARGGIPHERAPYFHEKVQPLVALAVEFLMESMPDLPGRALLLWLASGLGGHEAAGAVPAELFASLSSWAGGPSLAGAADAAAAEPAEPLPKPRPVASALRSSAPVRNPAQFVTPAGSYLSDQDVRKMGTHSVADEQKLQLIRSVPMFHRLSDNDLEDLSRAFEVCHFLEGEDAMQHGQSGQGMHIVACGQAKKLMFHDSGVIGIGESVGETEMLKGTAPNETLEATGGSLTTLHLDALSFKALGLQKKIRQMQRKKGHKMRDMTVVGGRRASAWASDRRASSEHDFAMIAEAIAANPNIREVLNLSDEQIQYCAREAYKTDYGSGEVVFERGEFGHRFYIIISGVFLVKNSSLWSAESQTNEVKLKAGDSFGELALLHNAPRTATVECKLSGSVWVMSRTTLRNCKQLQMEGRIEEYAKLLRSIDFFRQYETTLSDICNALEERAFFKGEVVLRESRLAECFSVIFDGTCASLADGVEEAELGRGTYFGERALEDGRLEPAPVTIQVKSDRCTVLTLSRGSFQACVHDIAGSGPAGPSSSARRITKNKLQRVGVLGTGAFGFVSLERESDSRALYALKAMSKGHIVRDGLTNMVLNEKGCQMLLDSDFVVRLLATYRDEQHIYLLLEPCFGGELFDCFSGGAVDMTGSEVHCRFFASCTALGLEHMHSRRVIWRDLKLENCLLTSAGYVKLTDLGIAKVCVGKTYTVCGTTDYFAPEMLRQTGHNRGVDWWALGVMTYMMMAGRAPFEDADTIKTYRKIIKGFAKVNFPDDCPEHCCSIIRALCQKTPEDRLTMGALGIQNFKEHPWYRGLNWRALEAQTMPAPYRPVITEEDIVDKASRKVTDTVQPHFPYVDEGGLGGRWDDEFDMELSMCN